MVKVISHKMLQEIDRRLNSSFSISTGLSSFVLTSVVGDEPVPVNFYIRKEEMYLDFFVKQIPQKNSIFIETLSPVQMGDVTILTEKVSIPVLRIFYEDVISIPSLVLGGLFTHKGKLLFDYRFHVTDKPNVVNLLKKLVSIDADIKILWMNKSEGLMQKLDEIDSRMPLTAVAFNYKEKSERSNIVEWKRIPGEPYGAISYEMIGKKKTNHFDMSEESTAPLLDSLLKDHIPLAAHIEQHNKTNVKCITLVPTILVKAFLVRFFGSMENVVGLQIDTIKPYSEVKGTF